MDGKLAAVWYMHRRRESGKQSTGVVIQMKICLPRFPDPPCQFLVVEDYWTRRI